MMWLCSIGLGFSISWLWTFFLNGPLLYTVAAKWSEDAEMIFLCFLCFHSLSFLFTAIWLSRVPPPAQKYGLLTAATLCMSGGTLLFGFFPGEPIFNQRGLIAYAAAAVTGLGYAPIVAAWGEACSALPVKNAGMVFAAAITVASTLLFVLGYAIETTLSTILAALLLACSLLLYLSGQRSFHPAHSVLEPSLRCPLPPKLILLLAVFYLASGFMHKIIVSVDNLPLQETYWLTNIAYYAVCLLAGISTYSHPDIDLRLLYRPALPLVGAGFILFPLLIDFYSNVAESPQFQSWDEGGFVVPPLFFCCSINKKLIQ